MHSIFYTVLLAATSVLAKVQFAGVNIAGLEFGCDLNGNCDTSSVIAPLSILQGPDGAGQMQHFVTDDQMNMFRLPVGWQYLVDNTLGATLDSANFKKFDQVMQACLTTGAYCIIDIHNYARWNGKIIGQSDGPTNAQFADVWKQLATKYKKESKVVFGIMNEPHEVDIKLWGASVQEAVTAIRGAGASDQMILMPGNNFTSAAAFIENGSAETLSTVKNPDGSTKNLIFDVHKYLDVDGTGTHTECVGDQVAESFVPLAKWLKDNKRQAILTETGGSNSTSCLTNLCATTTYLNNNQDVFLGYLAWSAGAFDTSYLLNLVPKKVTNGKYVDQKLLTQCIVGTWNKSSNSTSSKPNGGGTVVPQFTAAAVFLGVFLLVL